MTSNEERREAAKRKLEERLEAEQAQARKRRLMAGSAAGAVALIAIGVGAFFGYRAWDDSRRVVCDYNEAANPFDAIPPDLVNQVEPDQREQAQEFLDLYSAAAKKLRTAPKPDSRPLKSGTVQVTFDTGAGAVPVTMNRADAPCNVNGVLALAEDGYYDDVPCHGITIASEAGAILCGDPTGTAGLSAVAPAGGNPGWTMPDEAPTDLEPAKDAEQNELGMSEAPVVYPKGTVAIYNSNQADSMMGEGTANTGAGSLYFFLKDTTLLPNYSVVGTVDEAGMATLDAIVAAGIAPGPGAEPKEGEPLQSGVPKNEVVITKVTVGDDD